MRRLSRPALFAALVLLVLTSVAGCFGGTDPYVARRPGTDSSFLDAVAFPERDLLRPRDESPPRTLERINQVFRTIALAEPDEYFIATVLDVEIAEIRQEIEQLDLGAGTRMRLRLGGLSAEEADELAVAAELYMRWAIARMRSGIADDRVRGAGLLREAVQFDPDNAILQVILSEYLDLAGFRSNAVRVLERFRADYPGSALVDLVELRKRERRWKLNDLDQEAFAHSLSDRLIEGFGGAGEAPAWALMEKARLCFLSDSLDRAADFAVQANETWESDGDSLSAFHADLLLGVVETKWIEYERAEAYFARAIDLAREFGPTAELYSVLTVPWDLWTVDEQADYDRSLTRAADLEGFWSSRDPIWATAGQLENQIDYYSRVGETVFRFMGVDPRKTPPLTDPGRAVLRFGWPDRWTRAGQTAADIESEEGTVLTWKFEYGREGISRPEDRDVVFYDRAGGRAWMDAADSLRGEHWPPRYFNPDFLGRGYPLNSSLAQFREPDGRTRLLVSYDTLVPNYSVRYPLQGYRYNGQSAVETAVWRIDGDRWRAGWKGTVPLDQETTVRFDREFRRRAGASTFPGVAPGVYRIASFLRLRDPKGRVVHAAVDNGADEVIEGFGWDDLEASDLLLTSSLGGMVQGETERKLGDDLVIYGPDPDKFVVLPRADRHFFPGENLVFYLEIYNITQRQGMTSIDVATTLEKIDLDGDIEYSVTLTGLSSSLIRYGVDQWNVARSLGTGELSLGRYNLRVEVFDREGRRKLSRTEPFEVVAPNDMINIYGWRDLERPSSAMRIPPSGNEDDEGDHP